MWQMQINKWLSGMIHGYHFDFSSSFSLEKCLEILDEYNTWTPTLRKNDEGYKVITKCESDDLYLFEIHFYSGKGAYPTYIIGVLHRKSNHVRVVGRSRIKNGMTIFLIIYGCIAVGLTLIFVSTPLFLLGLGWSVGMTITIYGALHQRYQFGKYPEVWLKGRGALNTRL